MRRATGDGIHACVHREGAGHPTYSWEGRVTAGAVSWHNANGEPKRVDGSCCLDEEYHKNLAMHV
jgi:hypothetical protein